MLTWTTEPPKIPGWYWVKYSNGETEILAVYRYASHWAGDTTCTIRLSWERDRFEPLADSDITKRCRAFAGPIPEPTDNNTAPSEGE